MRVIKKENDVYLQFEETREVYPWIVAFLGITFSLFLHSTRPLEDWIFSQWLFTYEFQFLKRGLIGEIFRQTHITITYGKVFIAGFLILSTLLVMLSAYFLSVLIDTKWRDSLKQEWSVGGILFFLFAFFHSATLQHLVRHIGRFEHLQLVMVLGFFFLLHRFYRRTGNSRVSVLIKHVLTAFVLLVVAIVSILIHEAFLFFYLPLMFGIWVLVYPRGIGLNLTRIVLFGLLLLFTWLVSTHGLLPIPDYEWFIGLMQERYGSRADPASLVVAFRDFGTNVEYTSYWIFQKWTYVHIVIFTLVLSPTFWFMKKLVERDFRSLSSDSKARLRLFVFLTCLSPFGLIPLGFDYFRWFSLAFLNVFILITWKMYDSDYKSYIFGLFWRHRLVVVTIIILSLIYGPVGAPSSFRIGNRINELLGF